MMTIREEFPPDVLAREALLDACFGEERFRKTCQRLREGRKPAEGLSLTLANGDGDLIGTVRLWRVTAGPNRPALLLGPIAIDPSLQGLGLGSKLMRVALERAAGLGHGAVLLVGDASYYERFGFSADATERLWLPGPYERERFVGLELQPGALAGAGGLVSATGATEDKPDLAALIAAAANDVRRAA
jgi:predicted N-acetyltransferase YhbS